MIRQSKQLVIGVGVLLASLTLCAFVAVTDLPLQPESKIWVKGSSTVRDYTCNAKTIDANVVAAEGDAAALPLERLVRSVQVRVPVADIDCGNGKMNEHMRKALAAPTNPRLAFALDGYTIEAGESIRLTGSLTLAGRTLPIDFSGTITEKEGGLVRVVATKQVRMTEWGIKPPTLMMGTLKVHDPVTIGVDVVLKR